MSKKEILGGSYVVYEDGRIWSNNASIFLSQYPTGRGKRYLNVSLWGDGVQKTYNVHRLVANAFIPNPENKPQVNHKDCNGHNNNISNLEWSTAKENIKHAYDNGRMYNILKTNQCACGEMIVQRNTMCFSCSQWKKSKVAAIKKVLKKKKIADSLFGYCYTEQEKKIVSMFSWGCTYREIDEALKVNNCTAGNTMHKLRSRFNSLESVIV